jgi:hypothetical protein
MATFRDPGPLKELDNHVRERCTAVKIRVPQNIGYEPNSATRSILYDDADLSDGLIMACGDPSPGAHCTSPECQHRSLPRWNKGQDAGPHLDNAKLP